MKSLEQHFERNLIRTVSLIGIVRFIIAVVINDPTVDGYTDLYLDMAALAIFVLGFILIYVNVGNHWLIALFYGPLLTLMLYTFYVYDGLTNSGEVNAFAIVIIICLTTKGRWPLLLTLAFFLGIVIVLYQVEPGNLEGPEPPVYYTETFTLLVISLAVIWLIYHAKKGFDMSHKSLLRTNLELSASTEDIKSQHELLNQQNKRLNLLKAELEEKVLDRTNALKAQKATIQEYMELTLIELMKPYEKTAAQIKTLELDNSDELNQLIIESSNKLEHEIMKIKERLASDE